MAEMAAGTAGTPVAVTPRRMGLGNVRTATNAPDGSKIQATVYISPTGNDAATNIGSLTSPFATLQAANNYLGGRGTIIVRGGIYNQASGLNASNTVDLTIQAYNQETNVFQFGTSFTGFGFYSNNIMTNAISYAVYSQLTNYLRVWKTDWAPHPLPIIYWSGTNYGKNYDPEENSAYFPFAIPVNNTMTIMSNSFRNTEWPLVYATNINVLNTNIYCTYGGRDFTGWVSQSPLENSNRNWTISDNGNDTYTLYICFPDGMTNGAALTRTVVIPSDSTNGAFIYNCSTNANITIIGVTSKYAKHAFDFTGAGKWHIENCRALDSQWGIHVGRPNDVGGSGTVPTGDGEIISCEGGLNMMGVEVSPPADASQKYLYLHEENCFWHDNFNEASSIRHNVVRVVDGSLACFNQLFAYIDEGTFSTFNNVKTAFNIGGDATLANGTGYQFGSGAAVGQSSRGIFNNCISYYDLFAITLNDQNDNIAISKLDSYVYDTPIYDNSANGSSVFVGLLIDHRNHSTANAISFNANTKVKFPPTYIATGKNTWMCLYSNGITGGSDGTFVDGNKAAVLEFPNGNTYKLAGRDKTGITNNNTGVLFLNFTNGLAVPTNYPLGGANIMIPIYAHATNGIITFTTTVNP